MVWYWQVVLWPTVSLGVIGVLFGLWWFLFRKMLRKMRTDALRFYDSWTGDEDRRKAIAQVDEINGDQAEVVRLEARYRSAVRKLKKLRNAGAAADVITTQEEVVDGLAVRLRDAEAGVLEDRAYARFFYRRHIKR